jgi:galactose mutarotase-like enzyme
MATQKWTVVDAATNTHLDHLLLAPENVGGTAQGYSVEKRTLRGGLREGVDSIRVDNGMVTVEILPTRGMGIWKAWLGEEEIGWHSPIAGPVHPQFVPLADPSGLGWLEGFDELLVRCGLESNGAPEFDEQGNLRYALHGRIANRPAQRVDIEVDDDTGEIRVVGEVDEARFLFHHLRLRSTVSLRPGERIFRVRDEIINLARTDGEYELLYHINFGQPLLEKGSRVVAPIASVAPRDARAIEGIRTWDTYAAPEPGYAEQVYFLLLLAGDDGKTQALLKNAAGDRGVSVHFQQSQLPCFTLWKNTAALEDGYVTGLEPGTNFPNTRTQEHQAGRVRQLPPQATHTYELEIEVHASAADIAQAEAAVQQLQGDTTPTVLGE